MSIDYNEGIDKLIKDCVYKCDVDIRMDLWNNLVLVGGSSLFDGMIERLQKGIKASVGWMTGGYAMMEYQGAPTSDYNLRIRARKDRQWSVWIGGRIFSSLSQFEKMWITKEEYTESGPSIVHRKCN